MKYESILSQAIDLHVHVGPEIIARKFNIGQLLESEEKKLRGIGIKNHFFPTVSMARSIQTDKSPFIIDSVTLNNYVGGFNADVIYSSAQLSKKPIIVWFPTINSKEFLKKEEFEIPMEWVKNSTNFKNRNIDKIKKLTILDRDGRIKKSVFGVLSAIKETGAVLATGHISWQESRALVECAIKIFGIKRIIITHPTYQRIGMPIEIQNELASKGSFIEHCFSMYAIDKIPISKIARQIKSSGADNCILTSDTGQCFGMSPSRSLEKFIELLIGEGISEKEIRRMLIDNPKTLIGED